jgi:2-methylcitrate dehydratase PrpD
LLAECGFTADPGEVGNALQRLASRTALVTAHPLSDGSFRILHSSTKFHAACGLSLAALDAVTDAVGQQRFNPDVIRHVRLVVNKRAMPMDVKNPRNRLAAKFSLPYAVAVLLLRGQSGYSAYSEELLADPDVEDLQARIEVVSEGATGIGEARVEIRTSSAILEGVCRAPRGSPGNRTSTAEVLAKVEALASVALREAELRAVVSKLVHVGSLDEGVAETWASIVRTGDVK